MVERVNGVISEDEYMRRIHLGTPAHQRDDLLPTGATRHDDHSRRHRHQCWELKDSANDFRRRC